MKEIALFTLLSLGMIIPSMGQSGQKKMKTTIQAEINYLMAATSMHGFTLMAKPVCSTGF